MSKTLMKKCYRCKEVKDAEHFNKSSKHKSGLQSWCRECTRQWSKARTAKLKRASKRAKTNGISQLAVGRKLHLLLSFCAESDGVTVDLYCERVLRRHIRDHVLEDLVNI